MSKLVFDADTLAVVQQARGKFTRASLDEILDVAKRAREAVMARGGTVLWLTVIDDAAQPPDAVARKAILEAVIRIPRLYGATVVTSPFHRMVITAFGWIRPAVPGHRNGTFASTSDALRWLDDNGAHRVPWARLLAEASDTVDAGSR